MSADLNSSLLGRWLWILALALVAAALIAGFQATGGPGYQRLVRNDEIRLNRARTVSVALIHYANTHDNTLPKSLEEVLAENEADVSPELQPADVLDPVTKQPFVYKRLARERFELCVTYQTEKQPPQDVAVDTTMPATYYSQRRYYLQGDRFDTHPKGQKCYTLKVVTDDL